MENIFPKDELPSTPPEDYRLEGPAETTKKMLDELMEIVEKYYRDNNVSEDLIEQFMIHNRQVRDFVEKFSEIEKFTPKEKEIAILAAILHDITKGWGNFLKHGKEGAEIAEKMLIDRGISGGLARSVGFAIERHMGRDGYPTKMAKETYGEDFEYPKYETKVGQMVYECDILTQLTKEGFEKIVQIRRSDDNNLKEDEKVAEEKGIAIDEARTLSAIESAKKSFNLIKTDSIKRYAKELREDIQERYGL